jgi:hypothetical protein
VEIVRLVRLLSMLGSSVSLIGLAFMFPPTAQRFSVLESILLGTGIVLTADAVHQKIKADLAHRPKIMKTKRPIRDDLFQWIANEGKVGIVLK